MPPAHQHQHGMHQTTTYAGLAGFYQQGGHCAKMCFHCNVWTIVLSATLDALSQEQIKTNIEIICC